MTELVSGVRTKLAVLATTVADKLDEMDAAVAEAQGQGPAEPEAMSGGDDADDADDAGEDDAGGDDTVMDDQLSDDGSAESGEGEVLEDSGDDTGLEVDTDESGDGGDDEGAGSAELEGLKDGEREGEDQEG
jgi:hypothetical protein